MNKHISSLSSDGMRMVADQKLAEFSANADAPDADDTFADAVQGALSEPIPTGADKDRGIFERSIAARRAEKAKQQAIAAAALAKARQLTASIRSMEDALDSLLASEA